MEWAKNNDCLDLEVCVQYRDDGGLYYGEDFDIDPRVEEVNNRDVVVL